MNRCPITYNPCKGIYSEQGLRLLSGRLRTLHELEYSAEEQRQEAAKRVGKMSIQGVQPKLSAILYTREDRFQIVDIHGEYILKPQQDIYPQLPENEDLTMRLAKSCGIEVPLHGMVYAKDGTLTYFIKRFDRLTKGRKLAVEDFAQLAGKKRETKYDYSIEKLIKIIDEVCTFPVLEKSKFFRRFLFNYLTGNEDMHLKNYAVITRNNKVELSPAYDFLNTSIVLGGDIEESALSLKGKKKQFSKEILVDYLGNKRLQLTDKVIKKVLQKIFDVSKEWENSISNSFLNDELKEAYLALLHQRKKLLF